MDPEIGEGNVFDEKQTLANSAITNILDLHGFFPEQIPSLVHDFIEDAQHFGFSRLRIIHGKGNSRLKWEVYQVLKNHPDVESFRDAPPDAGGWGATIVLLKEVRTIE